MGKRWRYDPKDNRTPKTHPIFGHLAWGQEYDNPLCANDPDFVEVTDTQPAKGMKPSDDKTAAAKAPEAGEPAGDAPAK